VAAAGAGGHEQVRAFGSLAQEVMTSTAVEFARWYDLTDGIKGPVLFTSFERRDA
jgi:hypothetical protein